MQTSAINAQYGISRVPVHIHNGMDSPKLDFNGSITNRQLFLTSHIPGTSAATAGNYGHFFINDFNVSSASLISSKTTNGLTVISISEVHGRAGNDAGTVTMRLALLNPGDASISGGSAITTFDLKSTADTPVYSTLITGRTAAVVYPGQRLALQTSGTLTNVADVLVTVLLQY